MRKKTLYFIGVIIAGIFVLYFKGYIYFSVDPHRTRPRVSQTKPALGTLNSSEPHDNGRAGYVSPKDPSPKPDPAKALNTTSRPLNLGLPGDRIRYLQRHQLFQAEGFDYCRVLNNATFDSLAVLTSNRTTIAELNPSVSSFVGLIDRTAKRIVRTLLLKYPRLAVKELARFACYCAADGANHLANITESRLVKWVDPVNYFKPFVPTIIPSPSRIVGNSLRKYQLAILISARGNGVVLENIKFLIEELDDGSAVILIHIERGSEELYTELDKYLKYREAKMNEINHPHSEELAPGNVFLAQHRFFGDELERNMLWVILSGCWELLDLAEWHHVINLSVYDVPLRKSREIHRVLSLPGNIDKDYIQIDEEADMGALMANF
ncbi:hypothetical protein HDU96_008059 [Phlyctochytrium bullatum]|nr:hypothetical protein HDU96_008059 [Phlyctochytrium bullatum]